MGDVDRHKKQTNSIMKGRRSERQEEMLRKILGSLMCLMQAGISPVLEENRPFRQPDSSYCLLLSNLPSAGSSLFVHQNRYSIQADIAGEI